jgi:hypothetical protein
LNKLRQGEEDFVWGEIRRKILRQADLQVGAAQGRAIEWHFAEREVGDYFRVLFQRRGFRITVIHTPWPE